MATRSSFHTTHRANHDTSAPPPYAYAVQGHSSSADAALIRAEGFDQRPPPGFEVQIVPNSYIVSMRKVKDLVHGLFGNLPEIRVRCKKHQPTKNSHSPISVSTDKVQARSPDAADSQAARRGAQGTLPWPAHTTHCILLTGGPERARVAGG